MEFGRPPSHAVSSLTLISGTTLECRVIPTIRAGERRLLLRQGRSYLYDPGTCKCLRKFSGIGRAGNYFIGQIVARSLRRVYFPFLPSPLLLFPFFFLFSSARWIRVGKFFLPRFLRSCDEDKSARGKVGVIRNRGNTESTSSSLSPL